MSKINEFAAEGIESIEVSGTGTGVTLDEAQGFAERGNLDTGMTSAIVVAMNTSPGKDITPAPDAEVVVSQNAPKPMGRAPKTGLSIGPSL